jgi:hypothetical protein
MTPSEFAALLAAGALTDTIGPDAFFGHGLINARKAVLAAAEPPPADDPGQAGDVGHVFVRLLDADSGATLAESETDLARAYRVSIAGPIPAGRYLIAAGTDRDGDGQIGDAGEAFGKAEIEVPAAGTAAIDLPVVED